MMDDDVSTRLYAEGRTLMAAGQIEEALNAFRESVALAPHLKTLELMGECLLALGRPKEAIVPLAAAATLNPQVRAPALLAEALIAAGEVTEARRIADRILERAPTNRIALRIAAETEKG